MKRLMTALVTGVVVTAAWGAHGPNAGGDGRGATGRVQ